MSQAQQAFEAAAYQEYAARCQLVGREAAAPLAYLAKTPEGDYVEPSLNAAWWGWRTAQAQWVPAVPETQIDTLLQELEDLKQSAQLNANDLMRQDEHRSKSQGVADGYGYCQERLRNLLGIRSGR